MGKGEMQHPSMRVAKGTQARGKNPRSDRGLASGIRLISFPWGISQRALRLVLLCHACIFISPSGGHRLQFH